MSETGLAPQTAGERAGFSGVAIDKADTSGLAAMSREQSEIQAAMVVGKKFPRDELQAYNKLIASCDRLAFAEDAQYSFPRGGGTVKGPSINLAVEAARVWGNIRHGIRVVREDRDKVHIKGYAFDCETNTYAEFEDEFKKLIQRNRWVGGQKVSEWVTPDERDLRELINRRGAILVRNAILRLIPVDVIAAAQTAAETRIKRSMTEGGDDDGPVEQIRKLTVAFSRMGVTPDMLAAKVGHEVSLITADEIVELKAIWKSMSDGNSRREEHFPLAGGKDDDKEPATLGSKAKDMAADLKKPGKTKAKGKKAPPAPPSAPVEPAPATQVEAPAPKDPGRPALITKLKKAILAMPADERGPWMKNVDLKSLDDLALLNDETLAQIEEALP